MRRLCPLPAYKTVIAGQARRLLGAMGGVSAKVDCMYGRGIATYIAQVDTLFVGVPSLDSRVWQARDAAGSLMECAQKQFFDRYDGPHTLPGELLASMVISAAYEEMVGRAVLYCAPVFRPGPIRDHAVWVQGLACLHLWLSEVDEVPRLGDLTQHGFQVIWERHRDREVSNEMLVEIRPEAERQLIGFLAMNAAPMRR